MGFMEFSLGNADNEAKKVPSIRDKNLTIGKETRPFLEWIRQSKIPYATVRLRLTDGMLEVHALAKPSRHGHSLNGMVPTNPWFTMSYLSDGRLRLHLNESGRDRDDRGIEVLHKLLFGEGACTLETVLKELSAEHGKRLLELRDVITACRSEWESRGKISDVSLNVSWDDEHLMEEVIWRRQPLPTPRARLLPGLRRQAGPFAARTGSAPTGGNH